jgi:hypothetical protein
MGNRGDDGRNWLILGKYSIMIYLGCGAEGSEIRLNLYSI